MRSGANSASQAAGAAGGVRRRQAAGAAGGSAGGGACPSAQQAGTLPRARRPPILRRPSPRPCLLPADVHERVGLGQALLQVPPLRLVLN